METEISKIMALIGEPIRSTILWTLLDNRAYTATELANIVETSPQNISMHLSKLLNAELLNVESQGRHKYYKLSKPEVAFALEAIATLVPQDKHRKIFDNNSEIKFCRTCYDHLAGKIGVLINESLLKEQIIEQENKSYRVTAIGETFFNSLEINIVELKQKKRFFAKPCLDWSERKHHLSGSLGFALLQRMLDLDWIRRNENSRAITITSKGRKEISEKFKISF